MAYDQFVLAGNKNYTGYRPQKAGETIFTVDKQTGGADFIEPEWQRIISCSADIEPFPPGNG